MIIMELLVTCNLRYKYLKETLKNIVSKKKREIVKKPTKWFAEMGRKR